MSSKLPIIKQSAFLSIVPQVILVLIIYFISFCFKIDFIFRLLITLAVFYTIVFILRNIAYYHRKGIRLFKMKNFKDAIPMFEKSYEFFNKNKWIDRFRFVILMSSSRISYREMALINTAFCYSQINEGVKAREYYEKALREFPESEMAKTALNIMDASKNA